MRRLDVIKLFDRYAQDATTIPADMIRLAIDGVGHKATPEAEAHMREHLQQVFWLARRGLEPIE